VKLIGRLLARLYRFAAEARIDELKRDNDRLRDTIKEMENKIIKELRRELDVEKAVNELLSQKLNVWRLELKRDAAVRSEQIADAVPGGD